MIDTVVFDMDGVLVDSEQLWDQARRELAAEHGIEWPEPATREMMGMSSPEWSAHMRDRVGVPLTTGEINDDVVARLLAHYREALPLLPGASEAVRRLADSFRLGLATSSNRPIIEAVLDLAGFRDAFEVTVSSEEVGKGKPSPDVYLEVLTRMSADPARAAAIEDSHNGIRSARAAGMRVVAYPNPHFPPGDALDEAQEVISSLDDLTAELVASLAAA